MPLPVDQTTGLGREVRLLAFVLLAYAVYALAAGLYNTVASLVWPRLFADPSRPQITLPWLYALVIVSGMALTVTVAGLSCSWTRARQSRGWWLSGALFAHLVISGSLGIAQVTLTRMPPDGAPPYATNPAVLVRAGLNLVLGALMLAYLCRTAVMDAMSIGTERKGRKLGRLFLFGLLLTLAHTALVFLTSALVAVFIR